MITAVLLIAMSAAILLIVFMPELDSPRNDEPRQEDREPQDRRDQADAQLAA